MRPNLTIFKKGLILVSVPLLFQLMFIAVFGEMQRRNAEAQAWSLHTKDVLVQIQVVMAGLVEAETGSMSYLLMPENEATLKPYHQAIREVPQALDELKTLVSDNPAQVDRVNRLAEKATQFLDWHTENVRSIRAMQVEKDRALRARIGKQTLAHLKSLQDKVLMDDIRTDVTAFADIERKLDNDRQQALADSQELLNWLLPIGTALSVLIAASMALVFSRRISGRLATLADNARLVAQGQALSTPIGGGDEIGRADHALRDMANQLAVSQNGLHKQTRLLQSILESMGDGVVVADEQGKFLIFNPAAERIVGVGATSTGPDQWPEIYGAFLPDGITPFPADELPLTRAMRGQPSNDVEMIQRNAKVPEGVWISVNGTPIRDDKGTLRGGVVVFRNINERKRAEAEIRKLHGELEQRVLQRTAELAEANRDLAQKNQENEMFVYSVSHDLRSPLVNLEGFSKELSLVCQEIREILADHDLPRVVQKRGLALLDGDMAESIRFIQTGVMRLSSIIDALLRLSRAGKVEFQWQRVDLDPIVKRVVDSMSATISQRNAKITIGHLPPVWGDPTAVEQIFANLIGNAVNYLDAERPASITVGSMDLPDGNGCGRHSDMHTFYVRDNGLGIPEAYKAKVFKAFQRVHPGVAKGEGMGLTVVHRIVQRHGGKIWFESREGEGTTFFLTLQAPKCNGAAARSPSEEQLMLLPTGDACHAR